MDFNAMLGDAKAIAIPLTDLYGTIVGEIIIDKDGNLGGKMNVDSFWVSITRVGSLGVVSSMSLMPNPIPPARPARRDVDL